MRETLKTNKLRIIVIMLFVAIALFVVQGYVKDNAEAETVATSGQCGDNITWVLDDEGTLTLSGNGDMYDYTYQNDQSTSPFYELRENIRKVVIGSEITRVGNYAFYGCTGIAEATIPDGVITIGGSAFSGCTGLKEAIIPNSVIGIGEYAFYLCTGLTKVTIGNSVTSIAWKAFTGCTGLTEITIPDSVGSVSDYAFSGCTNLKKLTTTTNASINSDSFSDCPNLEEVTFTGKGTICQSVCINKESIKTVTIVNGVTGIGNKAFFGCTGLTEVVIPDSVTSIGDSAFTGCTGITEITIPDNVTSIGEKSFYGCNKLKKLTATTNATYMSSSFLCSCFEEVTFTGNGAISPSICSNNVSLKEVTIGNSVKRIGDNAFSGCTGLADVTIGNSVTSIGNNAFYNCTGFTEVVIPDNVTSVENSSFSGCTNIKKLTATTNTTYVWSTFNDCTNLEEVTFTGNGTISLNFCNIKESIKTVTIRNSVTGIGESVFSGCTGLVEVIIPDSVGSVGNNAFNGCTNIKKLTVTTNATLGTGSFTGCTNLEEVTFTGKGTISYVCGGIESVKTVTIGDSVTGIGNSAFSGCTGLTEVIIPDSVTSIEDFAFKGCTGLTEITIPNSVKHLGIDALKGCRNIKKLTVTTNTTYVWSTFNDCTNLEEVTFTGNGGIHSYICADKESVKKITIGNSVRSIAERAFSGCTGLTEVIIPESVIYIGYNAFSGCIGLTEITIPDSATYIGDSAFDGCSGLTELTIGNSITSIGNNVFSGCTNVKKLKAPTNVTNITDAFASCTNLEEITFTGEGTIESGICINLVKKVTIGEEVSGIGDKAFYNCTGITEITIPDSVRSIGKEAFYNCTGLTEVTIGNSITSIGNNAFSGCTGLTEITLPDSVTNVGEEAFSDCTGLTEITLPDSVTNVGEKAFSDCTNLMKLTATTNATYTTAYICSSFSNCTNLEEVTFTGKGTVSAGICTRKGSIKTVTIGDGVTGIGSSAFSSCTGLTEVIIPDNVTSIEDYAFSDCTNLKKLTVTTNASHGKFTFNNCTNLENVTFTGNGYLKSGICNNKETIKTVTIGNSVKRIADNAFSGCTGLTAVTIPDSVEGVGNYVFSGCTNLKKLTATTNASYGNYSFDNCPNLEEAIFTGNGTICQSVCINKESIKSVTIVNGVTGIGNKAFFGCTGLTEVVIPDSVTSIGDSAFTGCTGLTEITIPDSVTSIGDAFNSCRGLTKITIPDSITSLGSAFAFCTGLTEVIIPDSVTSIEGSTFYKCTGLTEITIPDGVTSIGSDAFYGCSNLEKVYIPATVSVIDNKAFGSTTPQFMLYKNSYADSVISSNNKTYIGEVQEDAEQHAFEVICKKFNIGKGETASLANFLASDTNIDENDIVCRSSNDAIAQCVNGTIYAINEGTCELTIVYENYTRSLTIEVQEADSSNSDICLENTEINLLKNHYGINKFTELSPTYLASNPVWSSDNKNIVTVDSKGLLFGKGSGSTKVRLSLGGVEYLNFDVSVTNVLRNIYAFLDATENKLAPGETGRVRYYQNPYTYTDRTATYSSSNPEVATIDDNGNVAAISAGVTTITVVKEGVSTSFELTVAERPVTVVNLNKTELTLREGESDTLSYTYAPSNTTDDTTPVWTSSDENVATIDENGKVEFVGPGTATITVRVGHASAECEVLCRQPMTGITINKTSTEIQCGTTEKLVIGFEPSDTTDDRTVVWESSNNDIATVADDGTVTGVEVGTAIITAKVGEFSKFCGVTVIENENKGRITGKVTGYTGSNVTVTLSNNSGFEKTITSNSYDFKYLANGTYTLAASAGGNYVPREYSVNVDGKAIVQDITLRQLGDANSDGVINASDITKIARHLARLSVEKDDYTLKLFNADRSADGKITAADATKLARYEAGIITAL